MTSALLYENRVYGGRSQIGRKTRFFANRKFYFAVSGRRTAKNVCDIVDFATSIAKDDREEKSPCDWVYEL